MWEAGGFRREIEVLQRATDPFFFPLEIFCLLAVNSLSFVALPLPGDGVGMGRIDPHLKPCEGGCVAGREQSDIGIDDDTGFRFLTRELDEIALVMETSEDPVLAVLPCLDMGKAGEVAWVVGQDDQAELGEEVFEVESQLCRVKAVAGAKGKGGKDGVCWIGHGWVHRDDRQQQNSDEWGGSPSLKST